MAYKLKENVEAFKVVDGPFAGKQFVAGAEYDKDKIPPQERHKFKEIRKKPVKPVREPKPRQGGIKSKEKTPPPEAGKSHEDTEDTEVKAKEKGRG